MATKQMPCICGETQLWLWNGFTDPPWRVGCSRCERFATGKNAEELWQNWRRKYRWRTYRRRPKMPPLTAEMPS